MVQLGSQLSEVSICRGWRITEIYSGEAMAQIVNCTREGCPLRKTYPSEFREAHLKQLNDHAPESFVSMTSLTDPGLGVLGKPRLLLLDSFPALGTFSNVGTSIRVAE
jgi:hypothetical protein